MYFPYRTARVIALAAAIALSSLAAPLAAPQQGRLDEVVTEYLAAYTAGNLDRLAEMLADDAVFEDSAMELSGREQVLQGLTQAFASMRILGFDIEQRIASGPRQVLMVGTVQFQQQAAPSGAWLDFDIPMGVAIKVVDGRVARHVDYVDVPAYMEQYRAQTGH